MKNLITIYDDTSFGPSVWSYGATIEDASKSIKESIIRYEELKQTNTANDSEYWEAQKRREEKRLATLRVIKEEDFESLQRKFFIEEKAVLEVTEEEFDEMLNVLPPYRMTSKGFIISEMTSGSYTRQYFKKADGKFYTCYCDIYDKTTWKI